MSRYLFVQWYVVFVFGCSHRKTQIFHQKVITKEHRTASRPFLFWQVKSLKRTFDQFDSDKSGAISVGTVDTILKMMGMHISSKDLDEIIEEIDEDGSGELEFPEFIQLAAKFLIEEDEEEMKWELKEAFRLYDKQGK